MLKLLLVLLVVAVAVWWLLGRQRRTKTAAPPPPRPAEGAAPLLLPACAHCGVHVPREDAAFDAAGKAYCGEEHRAAGPR